jgi:hypothetical protein
MTKYLSVSKALPGPIIESHQPGLPVSRLMPAAWASPEKACRIRIAFVLLSFSAPRDHYQHSNAAAAQSRAPPEGLLA